MRIMLAALSVLLSTAASPAVEWDTRESDGQDQAFAFDGDYMFTFDCDLNMSGRLRARISYKAPRSVAPVYMKGDDSVVEVLFGFDQSGTKFDPSISGTDPYASVDDESLTVGVYGAVAYEIASRASKADRNFVVGITESIDVIEPAAVHTFSAAGSTMALQKALRRCESEDYLE